MSAEKKYTERELIVAQHKAVGQTIAVLFNQRRLDTSSGEWEGSNAIARRLYPLPKVKRTRVVTDRWGMAWKHEDGAFWFSLSASPQYLKWQRNDENAVVHELTACRVALWADLLDNPTEEVEDAS